MASSKKATAAPAPSKAVTKHNPNGNLPVPQALRDQFALDAGAGLENATAQDFALPFVYLLQSNSPQVSKRNEKYVQGAEPGMFMNTVTQELYGDSITVIPCDFEKVYNEWIPRDAGGGFIASYRDKAEAEKSKQDGTQIVDTANHYVLVQGEDGRWSPAILSLTSTKLKSSRNWLSRISQVMIGTSDGRRLPAPSFARLYEVKSIPTQNDKGEFFTTQVLPIEGEEGWVNDPALYEMAKDFRAQLKAGQKGVNYNNMAEAEVEEDDGVPM